MPDIMPAHLQGRILAGTWSEQRRRHFREFETESGRSTRSKLPGSAETDFRGEMYLTSDEMADLEAFYASECAEGVNNFYMEHPTLGSNQVFRWAVPPEFSHVRGTIYKATLTLVRE